jgi:hypothetical protein
VTRAARDELFLGKKAANQFYADQSPKRKGIKISFKQIVTRDKIAVERAWFLALLRCFCRAKNGYE